MTTATMCAVMSWGTVKPSASFIIIHTGYYASREAADASQSAPARLSSHASNATTRRRVTIASNFLWSVKK